MYQFHLPGDKLGKTPVSPHQINTIDDKPINIKQYRQPPLLRDEKEKQIKESRKNDIIKDLRQQLQFSGLDQT